MRLQQKLVLLTTLSKGLMAGVLLLALPWAIEVFALRHTEARLRSELVKVRQRIERVGVNSFLAGQENDQRLHYDLLEDEFIDLRRGRLLTPLQGDTIATLPRRQQGEMVDFRVLRASFVHDGQPYTLEIGKSMESVEDVYGLLRSFAAYALVFAVLSTLLIELGVINYLLRPVDQIVQRLRAVQGPTPPPLPPLRTGTWDFRYLDDTIQQMLQKIRTVFEQEREFIANVSHELLTPISILQNRFENMLQAENLPEEAETQLVTSQKTLQRLTATLRTLLLISRIENAQFARPDRVDVRELLGEVVEELEFRLLDQHITLRQQLEGAPVMAPANRTLLFTLFYNLLSNAIKYNRPEDGRIALTGAPQPDGTYVLVVHNTGKPIPPEQLPHLFERFRRFDDGRIEGFGLGLAVVRSVAQFHFIRISAESDEHGTSFTLHLPPAREQ
ncbi:HAMP domain-containing histidine kinase [Hymenobacter sp. 15J16-1T3B]|uniref:sensor histidine kinase n=1 Tax=Hymenobacter sp. 15J16-1T3B TaxID=2886941 RepID=UPI001D128DAA|nr:HAMP domain-containing sensor histidine kinase [Hymenobacter sp. 15J16-1T3B]MCC3159049.1 HAMP domain-containing histidine kinase [Hymenobacter sp. 15J16-1T3B]